MALEKRSNPSRVMQYLSPILALLLTSGTAAIVFASLGHPPLVALAAFFIDPIRDGYGISELCLKATPLLLCAAGLSLCFRARIWNIGAEGQFVVGALAAGTVVLAFNDLDPSGLTAAAIVLLSIGAGVMGGLCWAGFVAVLKHRFNCSEILTSIMLNYVALHLLQWAVHGPLKDPAGFNFPESALLVESLLLPSLVEGFRVHVGLLIALLLLVLVAVLMQRSLMGYQIRVLGDSAAAARYAGFGERRVLWLVLLLCGGMAGLAGSFEVLGPVGQVTPYLASGYGFTAIIIVFLGRSHALGMLLASLLLALTFIGGENLQIEFGLPKSIALMFQGLLLFYLLATDALIHFRWVGSHRAIAVG